MGNTGPRGAGMEVSPVIASESHGDGVAVDPQLEEEAGCRNLVVEESKAERSVAVSIDCVNVGAVIVKQADGLDASVLGCRS